MQRSLGVPGWSSENFNMDYNRLSPKFLDNLIYFKETWTKRLESKLRSNTLQARANKKIFQVYNVVQKALLSVM